MTTEKRLTVRTFDELFREERLPSGNSFKLVEDTVDNALKLAEQDHPQTYMKKALQVHTVLKSVGGMTLHGDDSPGVELVNGMLDTDVVFLGLAWTAQMSDMTIMLDEGVPCPYCGDKWHKVPFGNLKVMCRDQPASGSDAKLTIEVDPAYLPSSMGTKLIVSDPTWENARRHIPERRWTSTDHIEMHRAMSCVTVESSSGGIRQPSLKGELRKMRMRAIEGINEALAANTPHMQMHLDLKCEGCGKVTHLPFDQGV